MSETQTGPDGSTLKDIGSGPSRDRKQKADTGDRHIGVGDTLDGDRTATSGRGVRVSAKRTADNAGLNERGEGTPRAEKVRRTDPIDETDDADHDQILTQIRSQPKPIFRRPLPLPDFYQSENTRSSNPFSGPGDSQREAPPGSLTNVPAFPSDTMIDNPVMLEHDCVIADSSGAFAKASSVEPEIGLSRAINSHTRGEPKALGCSDAPPTAEPLNKPLNRPTSPNRPLPQNPSRQVVCEDDRSRTAVGILLVLPSRLPSNCEAQFSALEVEEWEIRIIVGKRRVGRAYEYKVRWKDSLLSESEMGNAQDLQRDFEAQSRAQGGRKPSKPACTNRTR